ncbi:MAG TPA: lysophospholipid acyltransferase family protein [Acholeplasma sp.]|nr:lysophospholipid acyltransferase family protein [Acholeplasma sp.]
MVTFIFVSIWLLIAGILAGYTGLYNYYLLLWLFFGYFYSWVFTALTLVIFLPHAKYTKKANKFKHYYIRSLIHFLNIFPLRLKIKVTGKENLPKKGGYVIYANHKSYTDPFILYTLIDRPMSLAAKKGIYKLPIISKWIEYIGCIQIDRDSNREAAKSILKGIDLVKDGMIMTIFPEGGIKDRNDEKMVSIKAGAYKLATKAEAPIIPVTMIGTSDVKNRAPFKRTIIKVIIHKPIMPNVYETMSTSEIGDMVASLINQTISNGK